MKPVTAAKRAYLAGTYGIHEARRILEQEQGFPVVRRVRSKVVARWDSVKGHFVPVTDSEWEIESGF